MARSTWWRPRLKLEWRFPSDPLAAESDLAAFLTEVAVKDSERQEQLTDASGRLPFSTWRNVLRAKFAVEDGRGIAIRYSGFTIHGSRVRFRVRDLPDVELNEGRLVRVGNQKVLFGEIEAVENDGLILYVTRGNTSALPDAGVLEYDAEASKSKLRHEQRALDRIEDIMASLMKKYSRPPFGCVADVQ